MNSLLLLNYSPAHDSKQHADTQTHTESHFSAFFSWRNRRWKDGFCRMSCLFKDFRGENHSTSATYVNNSATFTSKSQQIAFVISHLPTNRLIYCIKTLLLVFFILFNSPKTQFWKFFIFFFFTAQIPPSWDDSSAGRRQQILSRFVSSCFNRFLIA